MGCYARLLLLAVLYLGLATGTAQARACIDYGDLPREVETAGWSFDLSDPGGSNVRDLKLTIDWGDGTKTTGGFQVYSHVYTKLGDYDIVMSSTGRYVFDDGRSELCSDGPTVVKQIEIVPAVGAFSATAIEQNFDSVMRVPLTLSRSSEKQIDVHYEIEGETATDADFRGLTGTVTFPPGQTVAWAEVTIRGDTIDESTETATFRITGAQHALPQENNRDSSTLTIIDDDIASTTPPSTTPVPAATTAPTAPPRTIFPQGSSTRPLVPRLPACSLAYLRGVHAAYRRQAKKARSARTAKIDDVVICAAAQISGIPDGWPILTFTANGARAFHFTLFPPRGKKQKFTVKGRRGLTAWVLPYVRGVSSSVQAKVRTSAAESIGGAQERPYDYDANTSGVVLRNSKVRKVLEIG